MLSSVVVSIFATPWTVACQAPLWEFSRQEYWSGLPFPSLLYLPYPGIEPTSHVLAGDSLPLSHQGSLCKSVTPPFKIKKKRHTHTTDKNFLKLIKRALPKPKN